MERDVIDGVTVLWRELGGPLRAELSFGCGHRDEELDTIGLTHFVQLLACPTPDNEGMASHLTTSFTASGPAHQVVSDLAAICSALTTAPEPKRMATIAAQAEPGDRFSGLSLDSDLAYPFASLLSRRYGARGLGLVRWPTVDYSQFTAEQVRAHARRYFTASNAVLTLTGRPPSGLRLPLPPEAKPERTALSFKSTPFWYQDEVNGAAISFLAEAGPLPYLVLRVVNSRLEKSQQAMLEGMLLDTSRLEVGVTLTPKGRDAAGAAEAAVQDAWNQLRRLASPGPGQAELDAALASVEKAITKAAADPSRLENFEIEIEQELFGMSESFDDPEWARMAQVTPDQVRQAVAGWLRSAIIVVPRGAHPLLEGVAESPCPTNSYVPTGEVFKPALLKRLWGGSQIVLSPTGVSIVDVSGTHSTAISDLLVVSDGEGGAWLGDPQHGCLYDISSFGRAAKQIWKEAPESRCRLIS